MGLDPRGWGSGGGAVLAAGGWELRGRRRGWPGPGLRPSRGSRPRRAPASRNQNQDPGRGRWDSARHSLARARPARGRAPFAVSSLGLRSLTEVVHGVAAGAGNRLRVALTARPRAAPFRRATFPPRASARNGTRRRRACPRPPRAPPPAAPASTRAPPPLSRRANRPWSPPRACRSRPARTLAPPPSLALERAPSPDCGLHWAGRRRPLAAEPEGGRFPGLALCQSFCQSQSHA